MTRSIFGFQGVFTSGWDAIREIHAEHGGQPPGYPHPLDVIERHISRHRVTRR